MKKLSLFIVISILFTLCFGFNVSAAKITVVDERTGVPYTLIYNNHIKGHAHIDRDDLQACDFLEDSLNHDVPITDPSFQAKVEEISNKMKAFPKEQHNHRVVVPYSASNQKIVEFNSSSEVYRAFMNDIPEKFKGEKTVTRYDVPIVITGDGNGNFGLKIISDLKDYKVLKIETPHKYEIIEEKQSISGYYVLSAMSIPDPNTGRGASILKEVPTLEQALDICAEQADLTKQILIFEYKTVELSYNYYMPTIEILEIHYGNAGGYNRPITTDHKNNSSTTTTKKANLSTSSTTKATQGSSTVYQTTTGEQVKNSSTVAANNTVADSHDKNTSTVKWWIIIPIAVIIGGGIGIVLWIKYKK